MKVTFEITAAVPQDEIEVVVRAATLSPDVTQLLNRLNQLGVRPAVLPITVADQVIILATADIIALEVTGERLTVQTVNKIYQINGQLKTMLARLQNPVFVQVGRSVVLNIDYLTALEAEFSGNMTAKMTNGLKLTVSRKFLPDLKRSIGM
ncbi:response regulator [Secundilactobacillus paracollinoides]|uniref:Response regulator n=1 Tax=Secundilactobacillus paracollinoides TaxID=240427 RepID=A0A1B2IWL7_9LACO|nr:LytTR family DNA-binding domain-containing protein [Secundilactobacillus paracollinoides]ANZ60588.1 response regulator [Secundilactobacillus paracollinoides]ANZ64902.1 response regulator [Secundilactobacillus paracollinoides]ANZ66419.1 response regulator [Secundilactobacillus paracollinoides]KRL80977.1 response regulator [Secundilactobacillus paracollinoides DSM 15502 = JCM 11969]